MELQTRCFVGEITEDVEVTVTLTGWVDEDGEWCQDDHGVARATVEYALDDRIVSSGYLAERFGSGRVADLTQDAVENAR